MLIRLRRQVPLVFLASDDRPLRVRSSNGAPRAASPSRLREDGLSVLIDEPVHVVGMPRVAAVLITSRLGSTRPSIAQGYELDVITMVILGGVSIQGGAGSIPGVVLAACTMGLVTFGLGLLNIPCTVMPIVVGILLIVVIALPLVWRRMMLRRLG